MQGLKNINMMPGQITLYLGIPEQAVKRQRIDGLPPVDFEVNTAGAQLTCVRITLRGREEACLWT